VASADQIKALLRSHIEGKLGHGQVAEELRAMIDEAKRRQGGAKHAGPIPISRPKGDLANLLAVSYPRARFSDIVLDEALAKQLHRVAREQRHASEILQHGLAPRRKLLLVGPPGTGKTLSASVLAGELGIPLFQVRLDGLITKFMGETAAKLRQIFDATDHTRGVYFFDEFDAIGSQRGLTNDVGEIRRVLNSFLQMIEQDRSHSLIVAATNHPEVLDHALFRRFDDVLHYSLPDVRQIEALLKARLGRHSPKGVSWKRLAELAGGLSYAEITRAAEDVQKEALIHQQDRVTEAEIQQQLIERQDVAGRLTKSS
jgi:SpoVK/Ycf46/Vps4 family AAA+-type ATPase